MAPVWKADYKSPWRIAPMAKMVLKHFQIQTLSLGQQLFCILDRSCGSNGVEVGLAYCAKVHDVAALRHDSKSRWICTLPLIQRLRDGQFLGIQGEKIRVGPLSAQHGLMTAC